MNTENTPQKNLPKEEYTPFLLADKDVEELSINEANTELKRANLELKHAILQLIGSRHILAKSHHLLEKKLQTEYKNKPSLKDLHKLKDMEKQLEEIKKQFPVLHKLNMKLLSYEEELHTIVHQWKKNLPPPAPTPTNLAQQYHSTPIASQQPQTTPPVTEEKLHLLSPAELGLELERIMLRLKHTDIILQNVLTVYKNKTPQNQLELNTSENLVADLQHSLVNTHNVNDYFGMVFATFMSIIHESEDSLEHILDIEDKLDLKAEKQHQKAHEHSLRPTHFPNTNPYS